MLSIIIGSSILSIIIGSSTSGTESSGDSAVKGRVEMTGHNEQGWEEVEGIREESNQRGGDKVQEHV